MPNVDRPYRAFGYPIVPALYIVGAAAILLVLFTYQTATTWPGLVIILAGVPALSVLDAPRVADRYLRRGDAPSRAFFAIAT